MDKKKLTDEEVWQLLKEPYDCENCLNYEYYGEEDGWQCRCPFAPPCEFKY